MTTNLPIALRPGAPAPRSERSLTGLVATTGSTGAWHYAGPTKTRRFTYLAVLVSVGIHVAFLFGFNAPKKKVVVVHQETVIALTLEMPDLKELDEPEPLPTDDPADALDPGVLVPMLADAPQIPQPSDFVQQIDFASLVEQPDLSKANLTTIPDHISRGGKTGEGVGKIFDLAELDREPVVTFRSPVVVPPALKRDLLVETVRVEFVVNAQGRVVNTFVRESSDHRYDDAAMYGVGKWKFRPGMKGGRKVASRMAVPIVFRKVE